jgi:hypothetical protein
MVLAAINLPRLENETHFQIFLKRIRPPTLRQAQVLSIDPLLSTSSLGTTNAKVVKRRASKIAPGYARGVQILGRISRTRKRIAISTA